MLKDTIMFSDFSYMERAGSFEPSFFSFVQVDCNCKIKGKKIQFRVERNFRLTYVCCFLQASPKPNPFFVTLNAQDVFSTQKIATVLKTEIQCRFFDGAPGLLDFQLKVSKHNLIIFHSVTHSRLTLQALAQRFS